MLKQLVIAITVAIQAEMFSLFSTHFETPPRAWRLLLRRTA